MPTDLSVPRWRCDVCAEKYEGVDAYDQATACEHRPTPEVLPVGTMLLDSSSDPFNPATWPQVQSGVIQFDYLGSGGKGHVVRYKVARTRPVPGGNLQYDTRDRDMWPGRPGALQQTHANLWARFGGADPEPDPKRGVAEVLAAFGVPGADVDWVTYRVAGDYRGRWHFEPQGPRPHGWTSTLDGGFLRPDLDEESYRAVLSLCDHFRAKNALYPDPDDDPEVQYMTRQGRRPWRAREWQRSPRLPHYGLCPYANTDRCDDDYVRWVEALALARYDGDAHAAMWWLIRSWPDRKRGVRRCSPVSQRSAPPPPQWGGALRVSQVATQVRWPCCR
jgi:hypothetical protein